MKVSNRGRRGRVSVAALLVVVMALSGTSAFADGGGSDPLPKPNTCSTFSEFVELVGCAFGATSLAVDLMY